MRGEGIAYVSLAEELGGFREGGYGPHARSAAFAAEIRRLAALAREAPTAFCCAERDPRSCHRRFVAEALEGEGLEAVHLLGPGNEAWHGDLFRESQGRLFEGT